MILKNKYLFSFVIGISLLSFVASNVAYSLHQLEHLNDVVCLTKDSHFHSVEHHDACINLAFFPFYEFTENTIKINNNYAVSNYYPTVLYYEHTTYWNIFLRGPPVFLV